MNILCLIQSFIPKEAHNKYFPVLKNTIEIIRSQNIKEISLTVILTDDGSGYLSHYGKKYIRELTSKEVREVNRKHHLNVDHIFAYPRSNQFMKASLFNAAIKKYGRSHDLIVFMDDDQHFLSPDAFQRFARAEREGYNFITGRLATKEGTLYSFRTPYVQGTTYAVTPDILEGVGLFNKKVEDWGLGDDEDMFWKVYCAYCEGKVCALFDGDIVSIGRISGRWHYCKEAAGGLDAFVDLFKREYNQHPYESNPSRLYHRWMDYRCKLSDKYVTALNASEFVAYRGSTSEYAKILWKYFFQKLRSVKHKAASKIRKNK